MEPDVVILDEPTTGQDYSGVKTIKESMAKLKSEGKTVIVVSHDREFLDGLTKRGTIIGVDLVEVAPDYDHSGSTTTLAAQILLNLIGRIHQNRR